MANFTAQQSVNVGKGMDILVNFGDMPQAAIDHLLYIGARNVLMDSHASITKDEYPDENERKAAAEAMVVKKYDALMQGIVRVASSREGDPVRAEAIRMASDIIKTALRKKGTKISDVEPKAIREAAVKYLSTEAGAAILAKAKARVEEQRAAADVDLADLGI